jgi:PAS domain-containing protein
MPSVEARTRIVAYEAIWPKLQELLEERFWDWLDRLHERLAEAVYMYTRRDGERVHYLPVGDDRELDLILSSRRDTTNGDTPVWRIERVIPANGNRYRDLGPAERILLQVIAPYLNS